MKKIVYLVVLMGVFSIGSSPVQALIISADECTYLDWDEPSENYGAVDSLYVHRNTPADDRVSLIKFNLSVIPENAVITSAKLSLYYYDDHFLGSTEHLGVAVYPLLASWTEGNNGDRAGASWTYRHSSPDNRFWNQSGARGSADRGDMDALLDMVGNDYGWKDWIDSGLTETVQGWYEGSLSNFGWVIDYTYYAGNTDGVDFWSDDTSGYGPKLDVSYYIIPEPATMLLLAVGAVMLRKRKQ